MVLDSEPLRGLQHHILRGETFDVITKAISTDGTDRACVYAILPPFLKLINNSSSQNKANHYREGALEM